MTDAQEDYEDASIEVHVTYQAYRTAKEDLIVAKGRFFKAEAAYQQAETVWRRARRTAVYDEAYEAAINDGASTIAAYDAATIVADTEYSNVQLSDLQP